MALGKTLGCDTLIARKLLGVSLMCREAGNGLHSDLFATRRLAGFVRLGHGCALVGLTGRTGAYPKGF